MAISVTPVPRKETGDTFNVNNGKEGQKGERKSYRGKRMDRRKHSERRDNMGADWEMQKQKVRGIAEDTHYPPALPKSVGPKRPS